MKTDYKIFESSKDGRRLLREEALILEVVEELSGALSAANISKTELALRLGKTKGFVSQILSGGRNLTLRTIASVSDAMGYAPHFQLRKDYQSQMVTAASSDSQTLPLFDWVSHHGTAMSMGTAVGVGTVVLPEPAMMTAAANQELAMAA